MTHVLTIPETDLTSIPEDSIGNLLNVNKGTPISISNLALSLAARNAGIVVNSFKTDPHMLKETNFYGSVTSAFALHMDQSYAHIPAQFSRWLHNGPLDQPRHLFLVLGIKPATSSKHAILAWIVKYNSQINVAFCDSAYHLKKTSIHINSIFSKEVNDTNIRAKKTFLTYLQLMGGSLETKCIMMSVFNQYDNGSCAFVSALVAAYIFKSFTFGYKFKLPKDKDTGDQIFKLRCDMFNICNNRQYTCFSENFYIEFPILFHIVLAEKYLKNYICPYLSTKVGTFLKKTSLWRLHSSAHFFSQNDNLSTALDNLIADESIIPYFWCFSFDPIYDSGVGPVLFTPTTVYKHFLNLFVSPKIEALFSHLDVSSFEELFETQEFKLSMANCLEIHKLTTNLFFLGNNGRDISFGYGSQSIPVMTMQNFCKVMYEFLEVNTNFEHKTYYGIPHSLFEICKNYVILLQDDSDEDYSDIEVRDLDEEEHAFVDAHNKVRSMLIASRSQTIQLPDSNLSNFCGNQKDDKIENGNQEDTDMYQKTSCTSTSTINDYVSECSESEQESKKPIGKCGCEEPNDVPPNCESSSSSALHHIHEASSSPSDTGTTQKSENLPSSSLVLSNIELTGNNICSAPSLSMPGAVGNELELYTSAQDNLRNSDSDPAEIPEIIPVKPSQKDTYNLALTYYNIFNHIPPKYAANFGRYRGFCGTQNIMYLAPISKIMTKPGPLASLILNVINNKQFLCSLSPHTRVFILNSVNAIEKSIQSLGARTNHAMDKHGDYMMRPESTNVLNMRCVNNPLPTIKAHILKIVNLVREYRFRQEKRSEFDGLKIGESLQLKKPTQLIEYSQSEKSDATTLNGQDFAYLPNNTISYGDKTGPLEHVILKDKDFTEFERLNNGDRVKLKQDKNCTSLKITSLESKYLEISSSAPTDPKLEPLKIVTLNQLPSTRDSSQATLSEKTSPEEISLNASSSKSKSPKPTPLEHASPNLTLLESTSFKHNSSEALTLESLYTTPISSQPVPLLSQKLHVSSSFSHTAPTSPLNDQDFGLFIQLKLEEAQHGRIRTSSPPQSKLSLSDLESNEIMTDERFVRSTSDTNGSKEKRVIEERKSSGKKRRLNGPTEDNTQSETKPTVSD